MILKTRIIHTHDVEVNWNKCTNFIPNKGEIIVYDPDATHRYTRFKTGDGITTIVNLPFTIDTTIDEALNTKDGIHYLDAGRITSE